MNGFATITGSAFDAYGPTRTGAKDASITLTPIYLATGTDIVLGHQRTINALPDGTFGSVDLWPGIWRIKMPDGTVVDSHLLADTTYDLIDLRGVDLALLGGGLIVPDTVAEGALLARAGDSVVGVDPASLQDGGLVLPEGVAEGQLLARSGDTVVGVDPASFGGGGAAAVPNWFNVSASAVGPAHLRDCLPGAVLETEAGNLISVYLTYTYFCSFILSAPGVVAKVRSKAPASPDGLTSSTGSLALYRVNGATDTLERVAVIGEFTQDGGELSFDFGQTLPAGVYCIGYKLESAPLVDPGYPYPSTTVSTMGRVLPRAATFRVNHVGLPESVPYSASEISYTDVGYPLAAVHMGGYA